MGYKTYTELVDDHIAFLHSHGLDVEKLEIDAGFIRCRAIGCINGRGELSYKTTRSQMANGLLGLATWCRGTNGAANFQSYGMTGEEKTKPRTVAASEIQRPNLPDEKYADAARRAYGFWKNSQCKGTSDYLDRKGVGSYGIRFRSSDAYGRVAVVPMLDETGVLWSYQLLNVDGTKRHPKDARTNGLFHCLASPINSEPIGIAESYVTAATCYELTNLPTVCAFNCHNLLAVAKVLRQKFPDSPIVLFADNDRHLASNQGMLKAQEACNAIGGTLAMPEFNCEPGKDATDWNDLVRLIGREAAQKQAFVFVSPLYG